MTDKAKKIVISIVVYNRLTNLEHWLQCWEKCDQTGATLVVIHNQDTDDRSEKFRELCHSHGVQYIRRPNVGFDIGAFQDVCRDRLRGFPDWDRLLWLTDDTFPMATNFVKQFSEAMTDGVGVACMEVSKYVTDHIRTTGFMLDRSTARRLTFPADPIVTKQHCYLFEHRAKDQIFYRQIINMGLRVKMVAPRQNSPLWDTGYHRRENRRAEHEDLFGKFSDPDRVVFVCPIYKSYPAIISSLIMQTHTNWHLLLIHDGPDTENVGALVPKDDRINFMASPKHGGCWGHYIRQVGIRMAKKLGDFTVVTNPDNYHVPTFCEYMLRGFKEHETAVAVYCSHMVHSYKAWQVIPCRLERGFLDCAGVMVRSWMAEEVGWEDISSHSADWVYFSDLIAKFGARRFHKVEGCLLIHN